MKLFINGFKSMYKPIHTITILNHLLNITINVCNTYIINFFFLNIILIFLHIYIYMYMTKKILVLQ